MDILGPFPISAKGNRYVLVIGDTFTKWIEAYAIADQTAPTIANVVVREFKRDPEEIDWDTFTIGEGGV